MKLRTPLWAIALIIVCTGLTSIGQYFLKRGADTAVSLTTIVNVPLIIGFGLYGFGAVLLIIALRFGELSILYPFISLGFVWVALLGIFLLHESVNVLGWLGIASIMCGVVCVGIGGNRG